MFHSYKRLIVARGLPFAVSSAASGLVLCAAEKDDKDKFKLPVELPDWVDTQKISQMASGITSALPTEITPEALAPLASTVSFGSLSGFSAGYMIKKGMKAAVGVFGSIFLLVQVPLRYNDSSGGGVFLLTE